MSAIVSATSWVSENANCLDLCGGTGMLATALQTRGIGGKWSNLDLSEPMLSQTPDGIDRILSSADDIPLPSESLDLVVIRSAFDYIDTPKALSEVARVLNPEGRLLVAQKTSDVYAACLSWLARMQQYRNPNKSPPVSGLDLEQTLKLADFHTLDHSRIITKQSYDLNDWVSRQGSIPSDAQEKITELLESTPQFLMEDLGLEVSQSQINYQTSWSVVLSKFSDETLVECRLVATAIPFRASSQGGYEIFLHRRFTEREYWGWWELPQGHVASGERFTAGAVRELFEETGLRPDVMPEPAKTLTEQGVFFARKERRDFFAIPVPIMVLGEPNYRNNEKEFRWVNLSELSRFLSEENVYPPNKVMLDGIHAEALAKTASQAKT